MGCQFLLHLLLHHLQISCSPMDAAVSSLLSFRHHHIIIIIVYHPFSMLINIDVSARRCPIGAVLSLRSRCPNHLNLPRLTTSASLSTPKRRYSSALDDLSSECHTTHPPNHHYFSLFLNAAYLLPSLAKSRCHTLQEQPTNCGTMGHRYARMLAGQL